MQRPQQPRIITPINYFAKLDHPFQQRWLFVEPLPPFSLCDLSATPTIARFYVSRSSKMATQILDLVMERIPLIATTLIVLLSALLVQLFFAKDPLSSLPLAGAAIGNAEKRRKAYLEGANSIYVEGYRKASTHFLPPRTSLFVTDTA